MKITNEAQLLDVDVRKKLIEGFESTNNKRRKDEAFKAYECLKDKTINYVLALLLRQFEPETVDEMQYAMTNISILRKVIDKLAKVYANGVKRTMPGEGNEENMVGTQAVEEMADLLKLTKTMKKANRYFRTFKNCVVYVRPMKVEEKFAVKVEAKAPFNYDAVENPDNPTEALAIVLSDYAPARTTLYALGNPATAGRGREIGVVREGEAEEARLTQAYSSITDQTKGGTQDKEEDRHYIWWSKNYHFTTNQKGELVDTGEGLLAVDNPILQLPFVNLAGEQDECFWAEGGSDLVDSGIKINVMVTNVQHVGVQQGYGQMFMTGKNLPKSVKVGPTHCIQLEQAEGEPQPTVGYLTANPPLAELKELCEMAVALMLSTNNLSTSNFSMSLDGAKDFASGIALLIDKSESTEDIGEQQQDFVEKEPLIWYLIGLWSEILKEKDLLVEDQSAIELPEAEELKKLRLQFPSPKPLVSESDQLDVIKKRKEIGLNTEVELIMRDDPSLNEEAAKEKLAKIKAEKQANAEAMGLGDGNQSQENDGKQQPDNGNAGPGSKPKAPGKGESPDQE